MVKKVIKSVLWRTGISRSLPPLIWKSVKTGDKITILNEQKRHWDFPVNFDNDVINKSFAEQNAAYADVKDYLVAVDGPVLIEPKLGIVILEKRRFLEYTRNHTYTYPNTFQYLVYKMGLAHVTNIDEAIHFDGYVSTNYYNFYTDILSAFCWGLDNGLPKDIPIIVGKAVYATRHFQWLLQHNEGFKKLPWLVLDGKTYLKVKKLYKPMVLLQDANTWHKAASLFNPPHVEKPTRRVFQYRAPQFGRGIKNMDEIQPILDKYGFEAVDTGEMGPAEQVKLFAETKYLVAIHGAGMTNMIFSNPSQLSVLEILPGDKLNTHFYWLAETLGCPYDAIYTDHMDAKLRFHLDPVLFERHLQKLLTNNRTDEAFLTMGHQNIDNQLVS